MLTLSHVHTTLCVCACACTPVYVCIPLWVYLLSAVLCDWPMCFVILEISSFSTRMAASVGFEPCLGSLGLLFRRYLGCVSLGIVSVSQLHLRGVSVRSGYAWGCVSLMSVRVWMCVCLCTCVLCFCSHFSPPPFEHVWGVSSQVSLQRPGTWSPLSLDREVSWSGAKASGSSVVLGEKVVEWGDFGVNYPQGWPLFLCPSQMPSILSDSQTISAPSS